MNRSTVRIRAAMVLAVYPSNSTRVEVALDMGSAADSKAAILALLNTMGEQEAYEFIRKECPAWFAPEVPA